MPAWTFWNCHMANDAQNTLYRNWKARPLTVNVNTNSLKLPIICKLQQLLLSFVVMQQIPKTWNLKSLDRGIICGARGQPDGARLIPSFSRWYFPNFFLLSIDWNSDRKKVLCLTFYNFVVCLKPIKSQMMLTLVEWHPGEANGRSSVSTVSSSNSSLLFHLTHRQICTTWSVKDHCLWSALRCWWAGNLLVWRMVPSVPTVLQSIWLALHHFWSCASESPPHCQAVYKQLAGEYYNFGNFQLSSTLHAHFVDLYSAFKLGIQNLS